MFYGTEFKVVKNMKPIYKHIGVKESDPEYFIARENNGMLEYYILDDNFGQPSASNYLRCKTPYAIKMRHRACEILVDLLNEGIIEPLEEEQE